MNREELRDAVIANIGGRTDKDDVINMALNLALVEVRNFHPFTLLRSETTVDIEEDDTYIDLPDGCFNVVEARILTSDALSNSIVLKSKEWVVSRYPDISSLEGGRPVLGYIEQQKLYVYPASDDDYTIYLTIESTPSLSSDSTENPIPGTDMCLISWATSFVFNSLALTSFASIWDKKYTDSLLLAVRGDTRNGQVKQMMPLKSIGDEDETLPSPTPWLDPFVRSNP
jgi:hypothetical protein